MLQVANEMCKFNRLDRLDICDMNDAVITENGENVENDEIDEIWLNDIKPIERINYSIISTATATHTFYICTETTATGFIQVRHYKFYKYDK